MKWLEIYSILNILSVKVGPRLFGKSMVKPQMKKINRLPRQSIVAHCFKGTSPPLPLKWFVLEMRIRESAIQGIISLQKWHEGYRYG